MAVRRLRLRLGGGFPPANTPFSPPTILDLLMRARALCIQKALEKSVIRVGRRENGRSAMNK
jgi:hypothetical protein